MTTLIQLKERAKSFGRDTSGGFVTDQDYADWANEASYDLAARLHLFDKEVSGTTATNEIALPPASNPALIQLDQLTLAAEIVTFVDPDVFSRAVTNNATFGFTIGRIYADVIRLLPTPKVGTAYVMHYKMLPAEMVNGTDVVTLPAHLERKLVAYMVAMERQKSNEDASGWFAIYEQDLPSVQVGREKFFPGPLTFTFEPNSFDLDPEAKHR